MKVICYLFGCQVGAYLTNDPWPGWDRYRCQRCGCWTLCFRDLQIRTWKSTPS